jgi:hypothetical protein
MMIGPCPSISVIVTDSRAGQVTMMTGTPVGSAAVGDHERRLVTVQLRE